MKKTKIDLEETLQDNFKYNKFNDKGHEGYISKTIPNYIIYVLGLVIFLFGSIFLYRSFTIQIVEGEIYKNTSIGNTFEEQIIFSRRGTIFDRNGTQLVWNEYKDETQEKIKRKYTNKNGVGHVVGYITYPKKDANGVYFRDQITGVSGVENAKNYELNGRNGGRIIENNAVGETIAKHIIREPLNGNDIHLTLDLELSNAVYNIIKSVVEDNGFLGGGGAIMDIHTGELLASVSYPEFDSEVISDGNDIEQIRGFLEDERKFFLNRPISGLFSPGSIIKPFIALGALEENIVDPKKIINVDGPLKIKNPFEPEKFTLFNDWKLHGPIDLIDALAVSSNVYFYQIGGGFKDQEGLGIRKLKRYFDIFDLADSTETEIANEPKGVIPTPEWKDEIFEDIWRIGDTYNVSIGQYGLQLTPLQVLRGISGIASGNIVEPTIFKNEDLSTKAIYTYIKEENLQIVRSGMRESVRRGTARGLNVNYVEIAAKTGTAEVGGIDGKLNSWIGGFFPYDDPKYAFVIILEKGLANNLIGGVSVALSMFNWINENNSNLFENQKDEQTDYLPLLK